MCSSCKRVICVFYIISFSFRREGILTNILPMFNTMGTVCRLINGYRLHWLLECSFSNDILCSSIKKQRVKRRKDYDKHKSKQHY